jgi:hypothetical protein
MASNSAAHFPNLELKNVLIGMRPPCFRLAGEAVWTELWGGGKAKTANHGAD